MIHNYDILVNGIDFKFNIISSVGHANPLVDFFVLQRARVNDFAPNTSGTLIFMMNYSKLIKRRLMVQSYLR